MSESRPTPLKIFASDSSNIEAPSEAKYTDGYSVKNELPSAEYNYILLKLSNMLRYVESVNITLYSDEISYDKDARVRGSNGDIYKSKNDDNLDNDPALDNAEDNWINESKLIRTLQKYVDDTFVKLEDFEDSDILSKIKEVDGTGSGLDADLLDGKHASSFVLTNSKQALKDDDTSFSIETDNDKITIKLYKANGNTEEHSASIDDLNTWRDISDAVDSDSSTVSASSKAVKIAYDKAIEIYNSKQALKDDDTSFSIETDNDKITIKLYKANGDTEEHSASIDDLNTWRDISDAIDSDSSTVSASSKAVKIAYDKASESSSDYDEDHDFSEDGYQKLSNGLIIQWGYATSRGTHSFPIVFPNYCFSFATSTTETADEQENSYAKSTSEWVYSNSKFGTNSDYHDKLFFIAIGN